MAVSKSAPGSALAHGLRRFARLLMILVLIAGILLLAANGLYYWYSQPLVNGYAAAQAALAAGMPASSRTEAERLDFYAAWAAKLQDLPTRLAALNRQPWTVAVLSKAEPDPAGVQALLEQTSRGRTAVVAYCQAVAAINQAVAAYRALTGDPVSVPQSLPQSLAWYRVRIQAVNQLEIDYAALSRIAGLDLAGPLFTADELGIAAAGADIQSWRQPVQLLQDIMTAGSMLETRLDALYAQDPNAAGLAQANATCAALLAEQQALADQAAALTDALPAALRPAWRYWLTGLDGRKQFISQLQSWWENTVKAKQSLDSAATDRATAKRYIADSLKETNVETAYLWTRTAQEARVSMNTAIDFANIALDRANQQAANLTASRTAYRTALDLDAAVRQIPPQDMIRADAFWLEG